MALFFLVDLPNNGKLLRSAILDFSQYIDKKLCRWIEDKVSFPSTMVDRITPSPTQKTYQEAKKIIHLKKKVSVLLKIKDTTLH